jgi:hypothetical protein
VSPFIQLRRVPWHCSVISCGLLRSPTTTATCSKQLVCLPYVRTGINSCSTYIGHPRRQLALTSDSSTVMHQPHTNTRIYERKPSRVVVLSGTSTSRVVLYDVVSAAFAEGGENLKRKFTTIAWPIETLPLPQKFF